ncbi:hypothetical protein [uncultured Lactobacillus sp.]|uniref:hypothetical protein n=1 Tax=uncultured Lactobacillus sp. TaxID=153152 RepID=UPI0028061BBE|nr:hypothetical protein [uncultured Lactobacillus sp.]
MNPLLIITLIAIVLAIIAILKRNDLWMGITILIVGILFLANSVNSPSSDPILYILSVPFILLGIYYLVKSIKKKS